METRGLQECELKANVSISVGFPLSSFLLSLPSPVLGMGVQASDCTVQHCAAKPHPLFLSLN